MIIKENMKTILSNYLRDLEFVNVKPVPYIGSGGMGPTKEQVLSHACDCIKSYLTLLQNINAEDLPQLLSALNFIQGSFWAIGFYSYGKILDDIEFIEGPSDSILDLDEELP